MTRKTFLTTAALIALTIGCLAVLFPHFLVAEVKHGTTSPEAEVMARTTGVLLLAVGLLGFSVRNHPDSPTLRAVLAVNLVLQVALLPVDIVAYARGTWHTLGSFVPNTLVHLLLAAGFAHHWRKVARTSTPV